jgi:hypothetical protein
MTINKYLNQEDLNEFRVRWGALQQARASFEMTQEGFTLWSTGLKKKYKIKKDGPFLISMADGAINANPPAETAEENGR